jgi:hypothetical protein
MRLTYFQGYVVTCDENDHIRRDAMVLGRPLREIPKGSPKEVDSVAVDRIWLVKTINEYEAAMKRGSDRIVELLEEKLEKTKEKK